LQLHVFKDNRPNMPALVKDDKQTQALNLQIGIYKKEIARLKAQLEQGGNGNHSRVSELEKELKQQKHNQSVIV